MAKREQEESLFLHIDELAARLPLTEFYRTTFPTKEIKRAAAEVFAEVTKFLDEALVYYRSRRLSKLADAVLQYTKKRLEEQMQRVTLAIRKLAGLKDVAHEAQTVDIKDIVTETGEGRFSLLRIALVVHAHLGLLLANFPCNSTATAQLLEHVEQSTISISMSLETLNERMMSLESKISCE